MSQECTGASVEKCVDKGLALHLRISAIALILTACILGVCTPLLSRRFTALSPQGNLFFVVKSFAAGVILATAFVHMLPASFESLNHACLANIRPWAAFPFAGFVSMVAALFTLMIDFWGTLFYQRKHDQAQLQAPGTGYRDDSEREQGCDQGEKLGLDQKLADAGIASTVSVHTHTSSHTFSQDHSYQVHPDHVVSVGSHHVPHSHDPHFMSDLNTATTQLRNRIISQVLELGIIAHSIIIGISLGASQSPCTIRPLMVALTFHQFFEGMALGGCIAQAGFRNRASAIMASLFSVTMPLGIAIGIGISSSYNENSPRALIVQGLFDSMSAGILIYMSLVDLIATDFLSERLQGDFKLQVYSYLALFLGTGAMSVIAYWA